MRITTETATITTVPNSTVNFKTITDTIKPDGLTYKIYAENKTAAVICCDENVKIL